MRPVNLTTIVQASDRGDAAGKPVVRSPAPLDKWAKRDVIGLRQ